MPGQPNPLPSAAVRVASLLRDPRHGQIVVLSALLVYGLVALDFEVTLTTATTILASTLLTQALASRLAGIGFEPRSALISGLSLCLLLRTDSLALSVLAAVIAIASKFLVRVGGKHVFNPTNLALVVLLASTDRVWVSAGQWGTPALAAFLMVSAGSLVAHRSARSDVSLAFVVSWLALVVGRSLWLGEPWAIPLHRLANGGLILFAFHMISDPKTTPNGRGGRILFAAAVAGVGWYIQFRMFRTNGILWSLALLAPLVPLLDRLLPADRFRWEHPTAGRSKPRPVTPRVADAPLPEVAMRSLPRPRRSLLAALALSLALPLLAAPARAFCGFYVAKADTKLFNRASKVVLVRDGDRTVMTMANDYQGAPKEFAVVIPVPTFLEREQIHVGERAVLEHLDAYTAPRLVEYFDDDPCRPPVVYEMAAPSAAGSVGAARDASARAKSLGVTIEASYTVGEYDILILSAKESDGLETWLRENDYRVPSGASAILGSYIKQKLRFFVAKVNLAEQAKLGYTYLRPLQIAFESPRFMLPIRLGTINADGPQELFVFTLTRSGRVETTNYRTVRLPSDSEIPTFVKDEFGDFYKAMFARATEREDMRVVFLEYAWDMAWCDPCAADPLTATELRDLGVFWLDGGDDRDRARPQGIRPRPGPPGGPADVFVTRLHVRYDADHFPEDLVFQTTGDRSNFQGRYVMRHPWKGGGRCPQMADYRRQVRERERAQAETLARLTGWDLADIRRKMDLPADGDPPKDDDPWWRRLWGN